MSHPKRYKLPTSTKKDKDALQEELELDPFYTPPLKTTEICEKSPPPQEEKKEIEVPRKLREIDMFSRVSNTKKDRPKLLPPAQRLASARYQPIKLEDNILNSLPSTSEQQNFDTEDAAEEIEPIEINLENTSPSTSSSDFAGLGMEVKMDEQPDKEEEFCPTQASTVCLTKVKNESDTSRISTSLPKTDKKSSKNDKLSLDTSSSEKKDEIEDNSEKPKVHKIRMRMPKKVSETKNQPSVSQSTAVNLKLISSAPNPKIKHHTQTSLSGSVKKDVLSPSVINRPTQKTSVANIPKKTASGNTKPYNPYKRIKLTGCSDKLQEKTKSQKPILVEQNENVELVSIVDQGLTGKQSEPTFSKKKIFRQKENKYPKKERKQKLSTGDQQTILKPYVKLEKCDYLPKKVTTPQQTKKDTNASEVPKKQLEVKTLTKPQPEEVQPIASTSKQRQIPVTKLRPKTRRFNIPLSAPTEDSYPEYNYNELVMSSQKEEAPDELEKQLEEIFGGPSHHSTNFSDLGRGYDSSDPFIDDSVPCDEVIPEDMTTEHGGFYVNSGKLTFRQVEGFNSDSSDDKDTDEEQLPKAKKMGKVSIKDVKHKTTRRLPANKSQHYKQKEAKKKKALEKKKVTVKDLRKGLRKL